MAFYLATKEVWRNRGRYFLFSLVIALITTLVLFTAALAEGLASANREYLSKLDAQLIVFQKNVDLSANASQIGESLLTSIKRIEGVETVGAIGLSSATIILSSAQQSQQDVSLIGVEPGKPGLPPVLLGRNLKTTRAREVIIDQRIAQKFDINPGDNLTIKTIQGTDEKFFILKVVGVTDGGQQYLFRPSIFVPYRTWDEIRSQPTPSIIKPDLIFNIVAVKISDGQDTSEVANRIQSGVKDIEVTDISTAIRALPGYTAQQNTLNTQQIFTLLIGVLVIGGFFQIQMLQKVPQIGVLKAIGVSNAIVAIATVLQIVLVTTFGVALGSVVTFTLAALIPSTVPIVFNGTLVAIATTALLLIGPLGGLVTVRLAVSVEPLIALGLSS
ncbi:MAG: ABC transporter permease [Anaerolineales bacterium]|jgi:putative ABC transport system permease protein